jgi:hypothetical protein
VIFKEYIVDEDGCIYKISSYGDSEVEINYHEINCGKKENCIRLAFTRSSAREVAEALLLAAKDSEETDKVMLL